MTDTAHHWLTLHRVRFPGRVSARDSTFAAPAGAECWRFCPGHDRDERGVPSWTSDVWGGLGIYDDRAEAEAVMSNPEAHLPWLTEAEEAWHALAIPVAHHGEVNWRGTIQSDTALRCGRLAAEGPMVVVTTAGFSSRDPSQLPRIASFMQGVSDVMDFYGTLPGNICRDVFNGGFDGLDGFTLSIWRDDKAMISGAYKPGRHKTLMDESRDGSVMDRSSFTRARIVRGQGTWDGAMVAGAL